MRSSTRPGAAVAVLAMACIAISGAAGSAHAACDYGAVAPGAQVAELETALGSICIELFADEAPLHVANFLYYLDNGLLVDTFFHRSVPGFVLQGGGFRRGVDDFEVVPPDNGTVTNEPCTLDTPAPPPAPAGTMMCSERGNERGTVALAKVGGDPDSGTTNWFVNLVDNRPNLDNQNGGFTVFGRVLDMSVVDAIEALPIADDDHVAWLESAIFPPGFQAPMLEAPLLGTPYGCFDPSDQATVLVTASLPSLVAAGDPQLSGLPYTLSAGCGTPTTLAAFTADPGPPECPAADVLAVRTTGPANPIGLTGGSASFVELTCPDVAAALAARALWLPDYVDHFEDQLVTLQVVSVPEPAAFVALPAGLGLLAGLARRRRARSA